MLHNERGRKVHRNYVNGFHKKNSCLGERGHYGPKNDTYFWICSKKTEFSLIVTDRRGFPTLKNFLENPPKQDQNPPSPHWWKTQGESHSTKGSPQKKIGHNFQEIILQIKETVKKNLKNLKIFAVASFHVFSRTQASPIAWRYPLNVPLIPCSLLSKDPNIKPFSST